MRGALRGCAAMVALAWRLSPVKLVVGFLLTLGSGVAWPLVALGLRAAVDAAVRHETTSATVAGAVVGAGAIGVLVLRHFAWMLFIEVFELSMIELEGELITLANGSAGLEHHERPDYADKVALLRRGLNGLSEGMTAVMTVVQVMTALAVTAVLLVRVDPWLLLMPLAALPPVVAGQRAGAIVERARQRAAGDTRQSWHLFRLATAAGPAKELRVSRLQGEVRSRGARLWERAGRLEMLAERRAVLLRSAGQGVFGLAYVLAVLLVTRHAVATHTSVGDVVLVITLSAQINQQVNTALQELRNVQQISYAHERLTWLREVVATQQPPRSDRAAPDRLITGVELRDVSFRYPGTDRPVLAHADVRLAAGSVVAVVGENGAGKTTLVKLLCRFYDPTEGTVRVDGVDLRELRLADWRQRISVGFQDFVRFELPARQTVGVGDLPRVDDEAAVMAAVGRAHADDVVERLEDGLSTLLGKSYADGAELSGGQWQKLALARAMMRPAPLLLVLDEPTSALDAEAEHELFQQYAAGARRVGAKTGAITVLVSHRFSTMAMADLILVVADGRIAESGSHGELMTAGGLYAELFMMQASAYR